MSGTESGEPHLERKIHIVQGEHHVDNNPNVVLSTILGSCVAACLWDPVAGIGGMNHFLLPGEDADARQTGGSGASVRYGVHAMELLVNGLLRKGAQRSALRAKLFGGARMIRGLTDIGEANAAFAERFLKAEGIPIEGGSLRGTQGRRLQFWPVSGRARQSLLALNNNAIILEERRVVPPKAASAYGVVELF
jgi:chemotaxis protein CheD